METLMEVFYEEVAIKHESYLNFEYYGHECMA
jgi:hypothetical protein